MVISALRFTLSDTDDSYNEHLQPIIIPMLTKMLRDPDLENRRSALTTFNSAMHNKPELVTRHLDELLPLTMRETEIKHELIREVQMGPFKHKVDDGLDLRKVSILNKLSSSPMLTSAQSAYETLYSLLESAFPRLNLPEFFDRVIAGIGDENDIRILCNLMLTKLLVLAPDETYNHLQPIAERFRAVLSTKPKENAVKQELEKLAEASKGVLKVSLLICKAYPGLDAGTAVAGAGPAGAGAGAGVQERSWFDYWEWVKRDLPALLKVVQNEVENKD
jgi:cullin-associated NEDD8-dissociated protein 1